MFLVQQDFPSSSCSGAIKPKDRLVQQINKPPPCKYCLDLCNNTAAFAWWPKGISTTRPRSSSPPPPPKHNGVNNTAERDLALQKECLAFLVHHVDWRDQFTFVLSLASPPQAYFRAVLCGKPSSLPVCLNADTEISRSVVLTHGGCYYCS